MSCEGYHAVGSRGVLGEIVGLGLPDILNARTLLTNDDLPILLSRDTMELGEGTLVRVRARVEDGDLLGVDVLLDKGYGGQ